MNLYKVKNLSKVDTRFYKDGDLFVTDRSIALLVDSELKPLQQQDNSLKKELDDLVKRIQALEEVETNE